MDLFLEIVLSVTIVGICAALAEFIVGYSPGSLLEVVLVGVVGAYLGNIFAIGLARAVTGFPNVLLIRIGNQTFDIIWTVIGSIVILLLLSLLRGGRGRLIFARGGRE